MLIYPTRPKDYYDDIPLYPTRLKGDYNDMLIYPARLEDDCDIDYKPGLSLEDNCDIYYIFWIHSFMCIAYHQYVPICHDSNQGLAVMGIPSPQRIGYHPLCLVNQNTIYFNNNGSKPINISKMSEWLKRK